MNLNMHLTVQWSRAESFRHLPGPKCQHPQKSRQNQKPKYQKQTEDLRNDEGVH